MAAVDHLALCFDDVRLFQWAGRAIWTGDHATDLQPELLGKGEVALVVGGHGHDRTGSVAHHHIVGDPDGDTLVVDGVDGVAAGKDARLLFIGCRACNLILFFRGCFVGLDRGSLRIGGDLVDQRMFGSQHHKGRPPERIGPRGEDLNLIIIFCLKGDFRAFTTPDPVGLHHLNPLGPIDLV